MSVFRFEINVINELGHEKLKKCLTDSNLIESFESKLKEGEHTKVKVTAVNNVRLGQIRDLIKSIGYYATYKKSGFLGGIFGSL